MHRARLVGILLGFGWLLLGQPALAQQKDELTLSIGEQVTLSIERSGFAVLSRERVSSASIDLEQRAAEVAAGQYGPSTGQNYAQVPLSEEAMRGAIEPNTLRLTFVRLGDHQSILAIRSGYDRALSYRATLRHGLQSMPTDVCMVRPYGFGVEQWPYEIDSIDLSDLMLVPFNDGDQLLCR